MASMRLGYARGVSGSVQEHRLYRADWGFALSEIDVPVHFFIGSQDRLASRVVNEAMAARVPGAGFTVVDGEGHLSLVPTRAHELLSATLGASASP